MGHQYLQQTLDHSAREFIGPWAQLCCSTKRPPIVECITAVEKICQKLGQGEADKLRGRVKTILKKAQPSDKTLLKKSRKP